MENFTRQVKTLFEQIYRCYLKRRPRYSRVDLVVGQFNTLTFTHAKKFPLLQLIKNRRITDLNTIEVIVKAGENPCINSVDLEWLFTDHCSKENTLYIIVTRGYVPEKIMCRLFDEFRTKLITAIMLGDSEMAQLTNWMMKNNAPACVMSLFMQVDAVTGMESEHVPLWWQFTKRDKMEFIAKILDYMGDLVKSQMRTLLKKLEFLIVYHEEIYCVLKVCKRIKISRKTFYNWCAGDPAFMKMVHTHTDPNRHENRSYLNSTVYKYGIIKKEKHEIDELWKDIDLEEITHETP
jgi:hypothetical protein